MDNFNDGYHDLNKLFSGIGLSRSPRQLIDEALSIAIPIMIKASVSPSNLDDLMLMSRALNRGNLGMLYHNVDDFINQIGEDIENGKIDAISKKNPLIPKMAEPWLDQWRSTSNRNRPYKHRLISQPTTDNGEREIRMHKDLTLPHMQPLVEFVLRMRDRYVDGYVPNFDPDDGGINAEILFLFEKPGPKTDPAEGGSGFISQDNNDPTAKATKDFLLKAGVDRKKIIIWNSISAWNGTIRYTKEEMTYTKQELEELLSLLPALRWIVLVGRNAQKITKLVDLSSYKVLESPHPSPKVRSTNPEVWKSIPVIWRQTNESN